VCNLACSSPTDNSSFSAAQNKQVHAYNH
jgi:hypothetical protein